MFFCLETKEPKVQGCDFLGYKLRLSAKRFELASLKQQIFFTPHAIICLRHEAECQASLNRPLILFITA